MRKNLMMIRNILLISALLGVFICQVKGQKVYTKNGKVTFYSKAPLENIDAVNKSATAILFTKTGAIQVSVSIKGFEFEKALMQEHFNENYLESDKYPRAVFSGNVQQNEKINYSNDGMYMVTVKGSLMIHNVSRDIEAQGKIIIVNSIPRLIAEFNVSLEVYNITIPALVANKISKTVKIAVDCNLDNVLK
ncbi:MAG: YceI family protein [Chitinophagaceae bacterium]|nr:MAG: YceI family protein [Chitinophagaceae bacterium]